MPFENLSGVPGAPAAVAAAFARRIEPLDYRLVQGEPVETYLAGERVRYLDSLSASARAKLLEHFEAGGVVLGTIYSFAEGDNPIVGISARMLRADGSAAWCGVAAMSAEDTPGIFGLGRVATLRPLAEKVVSVLLSRFPAPGASAKMAGAQARPLGAARPRTYRSAALPPGTPSLVCVLPLENRSASRVATRVVGELLSQRLAASENFRVVEAADFRQAIVAAGIRWLHGGDPGELRKLTSALGTSLFLQGTIYAYRDASPRSAASTPELDLQLTLTDAATGRVVWTSSLARKGTDYRGLLELGAISNVVTLSDQVCAEMIAAAEKTKPASPPRPGGAAIRSPTRAPSRPS